MCIVTFKELAEYLSAEFTARTDANIKIGNISTDSRNISAGDTYLALKGDKFDGHDYIEAAINQGATSLIISNDYTNSSVNILKVQDTLQAYGAAAKLHKEKFNVPTVAITGSCGKTTTRNMLVSILRQAGNVLAPDKNYNNEIGVPHTLLKLDPTHDFAVIEMGAGKPGDISYLMSLVEPDVSIITNVSAAHIEFYPNLDAIAKEKGDILKLLKPEGTAIVNVDDVYAPFWLSLLAGQNIQTFALENVADITCAYLVEEHKSTTFELATDVGTTQINMQTLGLHNVMNALAAASCARALDIMLPQIKAGLEAFTTTDGRLNMLTGLNGSLIIDDSYNAIPQAVQAAVNILANYKGKRVLVLGDMLELGEDAPQYHELIVKLAKSLGIDKMLTVGEQFKQAIGFFGEHGKNYQNNDSLIDDLKNELAEDVVVLVKGSRSMQMDNVAKAVTKN